eukprot:gene23700-biopygen4354
MINGVRWELRGVEGVVRTSGRRRRGGGSLRSGSPVTGKVGFRILLLGSMIWGVFPLGSYCQANCEVVFYNLASRFAPMRVRAPGAQMIRRRGHGNPPPPKGEEMIRNHHKCARLSTDRRHCCTVLCCTATTLGGAALHFDGVSGVSKGGSRQSKGDTRQSKGDSRPSKGDSRQSKGDSRFPSVLCSRQNGRTSQE